MNFSPRYLAALHLLLLALAAHAASSIVSTLIAARLSPPPRIEISAPPTPIAAQPVRAAREYEVISKRDIFNSTRPQDKSAPPPPVQEPLSVKLMGVVVHDDPSSSYCVFEDQKSHKQAVYRTGSKLEGIDAEVKSVAWDRVILSRGEREEVLILEPPQQTGSAGAAGSPAAGGRASSVAGGTTEPQAARPKYRRVERRQQSGEAQPYDEE